MKCFGNWKKRSLKENVKLFIVPTLAIGFLTVFFYSFDFNVSFLNKIHVRVMPMKTILWYFPPRYVATNKELLNAIPLEKCPQMNCLITRNKSLLNESDALLFSADYVYGTLPARRPGQIWIFHNNEPPFLFAKNRPFLRPPWSSSFNWTMDFRHDSDIVRPYARLRKREGGSSKNYTSIVKKKKGLVTVMMSNCLNWSGRLPYIKELSKFIPVDVYGVCGKHVFSREDNDKWLKYASEKYKFYLAFENLYCLDYISEKFFNNFNLDLVTVARGGGNYSRDAPPKTYINVADFKSPKELAKHLWYLSNNTDEYVDILKRKDNYYYEFEEYGYYFHSKYIFLEHYYELKPLCELCSRLHDTEKYAKTIKDIVPWFNKGVCKKVTTIMPN